MKRKINKGLRISIMLIRILPEPIQGFYYAINIQKRSQQSPILCSFCIVFVRTKWTLNVRTKNGNV